MKNLQSKNITYKQVIFSSLLLFFGTQINADNTIPEDILEEIAPLQGISVVPLELQNVPSALKEMTLSNINQMKMQGYINASNSEVSKLGNAKKNAKKYLKPLNEIKKRLAITPAELKDSPLGLPNAKLLGARQTGMMVEGGSTGLFRLFAVPKLGLIGLSESDFTLTNGGMAITEESINYSVNNSPAVLTVKKSKKGQGQSELTWSTENKIFTLTTNRMIRGDKSISHFIAFAESID